jgi:hypothetical protein
LGLTGLGFNYHSYDSQIVAEAFVNSENENSLVFNHGRNFPISTLALDERAFFILLWNVLLL